MYALGVRWLLALLAACGGGRSGPDAAPDAEERDVICERGGTSTVTGNGPRGPLDGAHVYVQVLTGFCGTTLAFTLTHDDPLKSPVLPESGIIYAWTPGLGEMEPEWSGTFDVKIDTPDEASPAGGTLVIERGTKIGVMPSGLRGTLTTVGTWELQASFDVPYCDVINCL